MSQVLRIGYRMVPIKLVTVDYTPTYDLFKRNEALEKAGIVKKGQLLWTPF